MNKLPDLANIDGFDWDSGNVQKNREKHRVVFVECEEVFQHGPVIFPDPEHSGVELRFLALGWTVQGRQLAVIFTIRRNKIRVISARNMSRKERRTYAKEIQKETEV